MGKYTGKYASTRRKRRFLFPAWVMILTAVLSLLIGGVVAYLSDSTGEVKNTFTAEETADPSVAESFDNDTKTDVKIEVGDPGYAVYVRAAVVVTWKDKDGQVVPAGENAAGEVMGIWEDADNTVHFTGPVEGVNYTMTIGSDWFKGSDGFYYHRKPVDKGQSNVTADLIVNCSPVEGKTPVGCGLNVEIVAQTIQAVGTTDADDTPAVTDAWKVNVVNGELTAAT